MNREKDYFQRDCNEIKIYEEYKRRFVNREENSECHK